MSKPKKKGKPQEKKGEPPKEDTGSLLQEALKLHQAGQAQQAEALYQKVLSIDPTQADAFHLLGILHHQHSDYGKAHELISRAIQYNPTCPTFLNSLANTLVCLKRPEEAHQFYQHALQLKPDLVEALNNLASLEVTEHHYEQAEALYRKVTGMRPGDADAFFHLGQVLLRQQRFAEAAEAFQSSLRIRPQHSESYLQIAAALLGLNLYEEVVILMRRLLEFDRGNKMAWSCLLGALQKLRRYMEARSCIEEALTLLPDEPLILSELGNIHFSLGDLDQAIATLRQLLNAATGLPGIHSNLLLYITHSPDLTPGEQYAEHRAWAEIYETPHLGRSPVFHNTPEPERRLRIGYVSPDFHSHSVSFFIEPVLATHDKERCETFCYMNAPQADTATRRIKAHAGHWRQIYDLSDEEVSEILREDQPDILVDLSGHTARNRLPLFARRGAPIQVAWIGYPNTTGLLNMDYRLVDAWTDPIGTADDMHTEKLVRLPHGFSVFLPSSKTPTPAHKLPVDESGSILFASFNNLPKINGQVVETWAAILARVPGSRLLIKCRQMEDEPIRQKIAARFARWGIPEERILKLSYIPQTISHLEAYNMVDIGLDPFPYNGATTTCEAVWMGVPMITLAGERHAGRVGVSILNRLGLPELVANSRGEYADIAVALAQDRNRLRELRLGMHERVKSSSLVDAVLVTRSVEEAYRSMWREWCARNTKGSSH